MELDLLTDQYGPEKVLFVHEVTTGLNAILVVDNTAAGPSIGGIRMAPDITVDEVSRLARAMTLKNAAAGLPHGGGKAGIIADPGMSASEKERLVRAFGVAIRGIRDYIPGPDMGLDETFMAYLDDEMGRVVGLPTVMGGIPLDELGATGFGLAIVAEVAQEFGYVQLDGARVVIQGFGAVGTHVAKFLEERGAVIVGVADSLGATVDEAGLDLEKLLLWKSDGHSVVEFPGGVAQPGEALIGMECDIWIPAARPDVFTAHNAEQVMANLVLPGANIAVTTEAEAVFFGSSVLSVPDFIANAGGVICGAVEYAGGSAEQAFRTIEDKVRTNTRQVLEMVHSERIMPRTAALQIAQHRIDEMMAYRRRF